LRTCADWGILQDTAAKGVYRAGPVQQVQLPELKGWLIEAVLRSRGSEASALRALTETPALFPFAFGLTSLAEIRPHERLEWFRQGVSEDMVALHKTG
jgi:hypothetical protein